MIDQTSTIPKGWKMTTLGEVAELSKSQWKSGDVDRKYIGLEHINQGDLTINGFGNSSKLDSNKFYFKKDDVLFGKLRPYFRKVWKAKFDGVCSTEIWVIRAKENYNQSFLFYLAANPVFIDKSMGASKGTHMPRADWDYLQNTEWLIPELPEQRAIAAVLLSLDDKIELLREQNKTLEAIAQTIFKEWFVNFNFPCATGKMVDSELGQIPEGWRIRKLGEEVKIVYGKNLPTESLTKSGYTVFGANGRIGFYDKFIYEKPQVLVSCRGEASGKVNISLPESFVTNNSLVLEIPDDSDLNFCFLKFFSLNNDYTNFVTGSAQPQITIDSLKNCDLLLPQKEVMALFNIAVEPIDKKHLSNFYQIQTLSALRDTLLPKLMKGEIRVDGFRN